MGQEGVTWAMSGEDDAFYVEDIQIRQYDADAGVFADIGELLTGLEVPS